MIVIKEFFNEIMTIASCWNERISRSIEVGIKFTNKKAIIYQKIFQYYSKQHKDIDKETVSYDYLKATMLFTIMLAKCWNELPLRIRKAILINSLLKIY